MTVDPNWGEDDEYTYIYEYEYVEEFVLYDFYEEEAYQEESYSIEDRDSEEDVEPEYSTESEPPRIVDSEESFEDHQVAPKLSFEYGMFNSYFFFKVESEEESP